MFSPHSKILISDFGEAKAVHAEWLKAVFPSQFISWLEGALASAQGPADLPDIKNAKVKVIKAARDVISVLDKVDADRISNIVSCTAAQHAMRGILCLLSPVPGDGGCTVADLEFLYPPMIPEHQSFRKFHWQAV